MRPRSFNVDTALGTASNTDQNVVSGMGDIELGVDGRAAYKRFSVISLLEYQRIGRDPGVGRKDPSKAPARGNGTLPIDLEDIMVRARPLITREDVLIDVPLRRIPMGRQQPYMQMPDITVTRPVERDLSDSSWRQRQHR